MIPIQPYNTDAVFSMKFCTSDITARFHTVSGFQFKRKQILRSTQIDYPGRCYRVRSFNLQSIKKVLKNFNMFDINSLGGSENS